MGEKLECDCGREWPDGKHRGLGCGVPIPTRREIEADSAARDAGPSLLKALRAMVRTHGMRGPCRHNSCSECVQARKQAESAIRKAEPSHG